MKTKLLHAQTTSQTLPQFPEAITIAKLVGFVITGMLSILAAIMTNVVESGGFWQYFWLGAFILLFVCAMFFIILATKDGLRLDHAGLRFVLRNKS